MTRVHNNMTGSFIVIESPLVSPATDSKLSFDAVASSPSPSPTFPRGGHPIDVTVPSSDLVAVRQFGVYINLSRSDDARDCRNLESNTPRDFVWNLFLLLRRSVDSCV